MTAAPHSGEDFPVEVVERAMDRAAGSRPVPGNRVTLLFDGPQIYPAMLKRIAAARTSIHLDSYIIRSDATGREFADALISKAREGVRVRIVADWLGSFSTSRSYWRLLRDAGASVHLFNPPRLLHLRGNLTRDHRKLLVVDGESAITGGHCIGNEWAGNPAAGRQPWRDTAAAIDGPAAAVVDGAFGALWSQIGMPFDREERVAEVPEFGNAAVRVVIGEPGGARASRTTELLLAGAAERVWVTDAYLVAPRGLYQSLLDAARAGVDVRVLVPGTSDLTQVQNLTRLGYRDMLGAGVRIFEWRGPMLHAKTLVVDGRWVRIGSSNLNLSSLLANYEIDVLAEDIPLAHEMEAQFRRDMDRSVEIRYRESGARRRRRPAIGAVPPPESVPALPHHPGLRERRTRTAVALWAVVAGARRTVFLQYSLTLAGLGVLFLFFPRVMALLFGVLSLWLAVAAWLETGRHPQP